jgi:hypothetical protein
MVFNATPSAMQDTPIHFIFVTDLLLGGPAGEFPANILYPSKKNPSANNHKKTQKTSG